MYPRLDFTTFSVQNMQTLHNSWCLFFSWWMKTLDLFQLQSSIQSAFLYMYIIIFYYYWFPRLTAHSVPPQCNLLFLLAYFFFSFFSLLLPSSPPPGGWREPAGLQRAAGHGGAQEDGSPGPTEAAEEGRVPESHPAPGPSAAAPPTLPQLPWGQPVPSGPQQDSRDRCFGAERRATYWVILLKQHAETDLASSSSVCSQSLKLLFQHVLFGRMTNFVTPRGFSVCWGLLRTDCSETRRGVWMRLSPGVSQICFPSLRNQLAAWNLPASGVRQQTTSAWLRER